MAGINKEYTYLKNGCKPNNFETCWFHSKQLPVCGLWQYSLHYFDKITEMYMYKFQNYFALYGSEQYISLSTKNVLLSNVAVARKGVCSPESPFHIRCCIQLFPFHFHLSSLYEYSVYYIVKQIFLTVAKLFLWWMFTWILFVCQSMSFPAFTLKQLKVGTHL